MLHYPDILFNYLVKVYHKNIKIILSFIWDILKLNLQQLIPIAISVTINNFNTFCYQYFVLKSFRRFPRHSQSIVSVNDKKLDALAWWTSTINDHFLVTPPRQKIAKQNPKLKTKGKWCGWILTDTGIDHSVYFFVIKTWNNAVVIKTWVYPVGCISE